MSGNLSNHKLQHCRVREVSCDQCNESMSADKLAGHLRLLCPHRTLSCPLGCGSRVSAALMATHEANDCERRDVRVLVCTLEVVFVLVLVRVPVLACTCACVCAC